MLKYGLVFLTGTLLTLSFPPFKYYPLAWVAFVPLFWALFKVNPVRKLGQGIKPHPGKRGMSTPLDSEHLTGSTPWQATGHFFNGVNLSKAFNLGLFCGAVHYFGLLYWIVYATVKYGGLSYISGIFLLVLLVMYLSLYFALFSSLIQRLNKESWLFPIIASTIWVGLEYIKGHLLTGFPWELLGDSQYRWLTFIQIADIGGIYLLSFLVMLGNAVLFQLICFPKKGLLGAVSLLIIMSGVFYYGERQLKNWAALMASLPKINLAVIQGNIDQSDKWDKTFQEKTIQIYEDLTRQAEKMSPEIIIWPETAIPFYFQESSIYQSRILNLSKQIKTPLLVGSPAYELDRGTIKYFNRAYLINFKGKIASYYDKTHLVPFGEYVPCRRLLFFLPHLVNVIGDFSPGVIKPLFGFKYPLGVLICFEGIFPELSTKLVKSGALLLINITNDAWFGKTSAPYQHLSMLAIRAVENRRSIARSANTGFSAFIKPTGEIINRSSLFVSGYFYEKLPIFEGKTFYTRYGDILAIPCLCVIFIYILLELRRSLWRKSKKV